MGFATRKIAASAAADPARVKPHASRPTISIVHVVFQPFGFGVFDAFLSSYEAHRSGRDHQLIILLKGFASEGETREYRERLRGHHGVCYRVAPIGYDLGSYMRAVRDHPSDYYGFFNSRSMILADDWLDKLYCAARYRNIGVVGATGSFESKYTDYLRSCLCAPEHERRPRSLFRELERFWNYPSFPNCHVRTNAFMLRSETLRSVRIPTLQTRRHAAKFENGRMGLTRQIVSLGLEPVVVDNRGESHAPAHWSASKTFWQSEQERLLVVDNQTARYASAGEEQRCALRTLAWGADGPQPPALGVEKLLSPIVCARQDFAVSRLRAGGLRREQPERETLARR